MSVRPTRQHVALNENVAQKNKTGCIYPATGSPSRRKNCCRQEN